jgi:hypothetical protein
LELPGCAGAVDDLGADSKYVKSDFSETLALEKMTVGATRVYGSIGMGFSEFEIYGNYIHLNFPSDYKLRKLRPLRSGAERTGPVPGPKDLHCLSRK